MRPTRTTILIAIIATLLTASCSGDHPPPIATSDPPSAATPSASPVPSATPTPTPNEALPRTPRAFIAAWFGWLAELNQTGDSAKFRRTASPVCEGCTRNIRFFRQMYRDGGWVKGGDFSTGRARLLGTIKSRQTWLIDTHATPTRYKETAGGPLKRLEGGDAVMRLVIEPKGQSFEVVGLYQEAS